MGYRMSNQHKWDQRYLRVARLVALWSKDPSTKCGAVIVRPDNTLSSVGFNGFARGMDDSPELYADRSIKYPNILHSEWNSIRSSQDPSLKGYTVYSWPIPPCNECTAALMQKKVGRVVAEDPTVAPGDVFARWKPMFDDANDMHKQLIIPIEYSGIEGDVLPEVLFDHSNKWHGRFLNLAHEVSTWSNDPVAPRSAIIVRSDKTVASLGFNGYPQKIDDTPLQDNAEGSRSARLIPAELNAILFAQDPTLQGHTVYTWPSAPSLRAVNHLIQEGISTVVAPDTEGGLEEGVKELLAKMNIELVLVKAK